MKRSGAREGRFGGFFVILRCMASERLSKYIWIIDTITRRGRITRAELSELWLRSPLSDGKPIPHRTFFAYRREIESIFDIDIECDRATYEYYIEAPEAAGAEAFRSWMLDSYSMQQAASDARQIQGRIMVENVPSARGHLPAVLRAMRQGRRILFTYAGFTRPLPERGIEFEPYFVRLFRQRWYMIGRRVKDGQVRTYALDRVAALTIGAESFAVPDGFDPEGYFDGIFGITQSHGQAAEVRLRVLPRSAKYLRALPLHPSQKEEVYSDHSIFTYRLKPTPDLERELLTFGTDLTVLEPATLRRSMAATLQKTLENYDTDAG